MKTLADYRDEIDVLNGEIVKALLRRRKYPARLDFYESIPQEKLIEMGYDAEWINLYHFPIVKEICGPNQDQVDINNFPLFQYLNTDEYPDSYPVFSESEFIKVDVDLNKLITKRIQIGKSVIEAKAANGASVTDNDRESEIMFRVRAYALKLDSEMDLNRIENCFKTLIEFNKQIQKMYSDVVNGHHEMETYPLFDTKTAEI